jgi:hypothetical protein
VLVCLGAASGRGREAHLVDHTVPWRMRPRRVGRLDHGGDRDANLSAVWAPDAFGVRQLDRGPNASARLVLNGSTPTLGQGRRGALGDLVLMGSSGKRSLARQQRHPIWPRVALVLLL